MTLFHLRELWSTNCGASEEFDKTSLCICNIDNSASGHDKIVTASFNGILRVFKLPGLNEADKSGSTQGQASDLLLEVDFKESILQIASGLLLASTNIQLAVLHPTKFSVYSISSTSGAAEHGTSYNVLLIYEHTFDFKAVSILLGSFGQIKGKEIVCVQSNSSALNFYENESFSFSFNRDNGPRRFPMELAYIPNRDLIIMSDNLYNIECYRYQELAMSNLTYRNDEPRLQDEKKSLTAEWRFSFGETVLDIATVCLDKWFVVLLGERNLCVLRENGSVWFQKRFDANPSCLCVYANESRDAVVSIVGTHMLNVLIYQNDCLKWATKTPFVPVSIRRGNFADIAGALVMLSEEGQLAVGYLGTNPSLKIISMPSPNDATTTDKMNDELKELKKVVNTYNLEGNKNSEQDNKLACYLDLKQLRVDIGRTGGLEGCVMSIQFELTTMISIKDVRVVFYGNDFYQPSTDRCILADGLEKSLTQKITLKAKSAHLPLSDKLKCCVLFNKDNGSRTVNKWIRLPFDQLIRRANGAPKSHKFCVKLMLDKLEKGMEEKASLGALYEEMSLSSGSEFSFHFETNPQVEATMHVSHSGESMTYSVESNSIAGLYRSLKELVRRLTAKSLHPKSIPVQVNFHPVDALCVHMESRLKHRNLLSSYQQDLDRFSQHYRVLQKRILVKLKDKNPTSLANFEKLLKTIHAKINENVDKIATTKAALENQNFIIWSHLKILKLLLKLAAKHEQLKSEQTGQVTSTGAFSNTQRLFPKLISIRQLGDFSKNWEEQLESNLLEILQLNRDITNLAKVIDYEQNRMQNCQTLRTTLRTAYHTYCEQANCTNTLQII